MQWWWSHKVTYFAFSVLSLSPVNSKSFSGHNLNSFLEGE